MTILRCFTLGKEHLTNGINADAFDSILCDPDTESFEFCQIEMFQLLDKDMLTKHSKIPSGCVSLSFVHPVFDINTEEIDKTASVLAVDARYWRPAHDRQRMFIIDPCGNKNKILILAGREHNQLLVSTHSHKTVYIGDDGIPIIRPARRAYVLMDALIEGTSHYNTQWDVAPNQISVRHIESPKED